MRCDQPMGLCQEAIEFLRYNEIRPETCKECHRPYPLDLEIIGHYEGMYNTEYPLFRHKLIGHTFADEFVQAVVHDSGPMIYLGLRIGDIEIKWTSVDIYGEDAPYEENYNCEEDLSAPYGLDD